MRDAHQREAALFEAAMELPPGARADYLDGACGGDAALRQRVEALLAAAEHSCSHLDAPPNPTVSGSTPGSGSPLPTEKAGDRIGRYKLLQQIGEGGCGVVYMAEQEEPVRRRVALKVIKLGLDTRAVISRFEAERQALALMDHPNIARVLDGGATETGRPFFVMELVRGTKITDYCDEAKLSPRARLDLFVQVCKAIQHAHQKGIIHRDIKPSNILVTVNDGVAVPKVIDFGIAKATTGQRLTEQTVFTAFEQFIGTPAYMSPEQAVLTSVDIDTRSDVYALGVLLYELLTGRTPFDARELLAAGLEAMRRTIREQEPARPSTRLSTLPGAELSTTAQRRGIAAPTLVSELRGDLDWIVMKCLEKDRARRYETANGLAADIQRHLENEPVTARPPSTAYRLGKTVRRHRIACTAGAAVFVSLLLGLTLATIALHGERQARQRADEQTAVAQAVSSFLTDDLLRQTSSYKQADSGFVADPGLTVRDALERAAGRIGERFREQPLQEAAVRAAIGEGLLGLGDYERAIPHLERALALRRSKLPPGSPELVSALNPLGWALFDAERRAEAMPLLEEAWRIGKATLGPAARDTLRAESNLAIARADAGQSDRAVALSEEVWKLRRDTFGSDDRGTLRAMGNLVWVHRVAGHTNQAVRLGEEVLELSRVRLGTNDLETADCHYNLAQCYADTGRPSGALANFEAAERIYAAGFGSDHPKTLTTMHVRALLLDRTGDHDGALGLYEETVRRLRARRSSVHPQTLKALMNMAAAFGKAGRYEQAIALGEEVLERMRERLGPTHGLTLGALNNLAIARINTGQFEQAIPLCEEAWKGRQTAFGLGHRDTLISMFCWARALAGAGRTDRGISVMEENLRLRRENLGDTDPQTVDTKMVLAGYYRSVRQFDRAVPLVEEFLKWLVAREGGYTSTVVGEMSDLAILHAQAKDLARAESVCREALGHLRSATNNPEMQTNAVRAPVLSQLANTIRLRGQPAEARSFAEEAVNLCRSHPDWPADQRQRALDSLDKVLLDLGEVEPRRSVHREYLNEVRASSEAGNPEAMNQLAWTLAVDRDPTLRDGREAVRWAEKCLAAAGTNDWGVLDTLAVACAEAGEFDRAVEIQGRSVRLAPDEKTRADLSERLKLFEARKPFHDP